MFGMMDHLFHPSITIKYGDLIIQLKTTHSYVAWGLRYASVSLEHMMERLSIVQTLQG